MAIVPSGANASIANSAKAVRMRKATGCRPPQGTVISFAETDIADVKADRLAGSAAGLTATVSSRPQRSGLAKSGIGETEYVIFRHI